LFLLLTRIPNANVTNRYLRFVDDDFVKLVRTTAIFGQFEVRPISRSRSRRRCGRRRRRCNRFRRRSSRRCRRCSARAFGRRRSRALTR
jgi:hypothetical protein